MSLSTFFLIIAIIAITILRYFLYKISTEKESSLIKNENLEINEKVAVYDHYDDMGNSLFYAYVKDGSEKTIELYSIPQ